MDRTGRVNHPCIRFLVWQLTSHLGQPRGWPATITCHTNGNLYNVTARILDQTGNFDTIALDRKSADPAFKIVLRFPDDRTATRTLAGELGGVRSFDIIFD